MTTINDLAQIDTAADADKLMLYSEANSATRAITVVNMRTAIANLDTAALTQLAQPDGAALVGYGSSTVGDTLNALPSEFAAKTNTADLAASGGSALVGFQQADTGSAARKAQDKLREVISVSDYSNLASVVSAKTPGDAASHTATSFTSMRAAIQAALDKAYANGGGTVIINGSGPLLVDDYIRVKANTRVVFEVPIKLADYTTVGATILLDGDNIELVSPRVDNSSIFAGGSGQNGIGHISGGNIKVRGGMIQNCARGNTAGMDGGKAFQFEATNGHVIVDGTSITGCFMAMSAQHDFTQTTACGPLLFTNITAENCNILLFVRQVGGTDTTGQAHTVALENFIAKNCGSTDGVMQFSRAANVKVANGQITNSASVDSLIRGNVRFSTFDNIQFAGDCTSLINLDPSQYAVDASYVQANNTYDIHHTGQAGYIAFASATTANRVLSDCEIFAHLNNDVTTKIVGDELRNAYCKLSLHQGGKTILTTTATMYLESKAKFADFAAGISIPRVNSGQVSFPATPNYSSDPNTLDSFKKFGTWTPTDNSGAAMTFATAYGDYIKIGPLVVASFAVTFPTTATTFSASVGGLPVASANNSGRIVCGLSLRYTDYGGLITAANNPGSSTFGLINGSGTVLKNVDLSGKTVQGVLTYLAGN